MKNEKFISKTFKRMKCYSFDLSSCSAKDLYNYSTLINRLMRNLFTKKAVFLFLMFDFLGFSQSDSLRIETHAQIFSLSPISKKVDKVNGLVFGVGHFNNKNSKNQTINGLNVEVNGAPIAGAFLGFMAIVYLPEILKNNKTPDSLKHTGEFIKIEKWNSNLNLKINGINLTTGCFFTSTSMNGLNVSLGNKFNTYNGLSISALGTMADNQNGASVGLYNGNNCLKGMTIGIMNSSYEFRGSQIGIINYCKENKGIQIGIFNRSYSRGLQVGIWNVNNKRSFPFLNW